MQVYRNPDLLAVLTRQAELMLTLARNNKPKIHIIMSGENAVSYRVLTNGFVTHTKSVPNVILCKFVPIIDSVLCCCRLQVLRKPDTKNRKAPERNRMVFLISVCV